MQSDRLQQDRSSGQSLDDDALFRMAAGVVARSQQLHFPLFSLFVSQQLQLYFAAELMFFTMHWLRGITAKAIKKKGFRTMKSFEWIYERYL